MAVQFCCPHIETVRPRQSSPASASYVLCIQGATSVAPAARFEAFQARCFTRLRSRSSRTVGRVEVSRPSTYARTVTPASSPPMSNWMVAIRSIHSTNPGVTDKIRSEADYCPCVPRSLTLLRRRVSENRMSLRLTWRCRLPHPEMATRLNLDS
jgi:hypothetical protein